MRLALHYRDVTQNTLVWPFKDIMQQYDDFFEESQLLFFIFTGADLSGLRNLTGLDRL